MAIEYKAFSGGKEIDSFYSGGKEIQEIWGGDTLLWKKGSSSVSFDLTVTEGLDYFVPPSSFFTAIKQIWSYVKKKYKLNTTNFLFLCNC